MIQSLVAVLLNSWLFHNEHKLYFSLITFSCCLTLPCTHRSHRQIKAITSNDPYGLGSPPGLISDVTIDIFDCFHGIPLLIRWFFRRSSWDLGGMYVFAAQETLCLFILEVALFSWLLIRMEHLSHCASTVTLSSTPTKTISPFLQGPAWGALFYIGLPV